MKNVNKITLIIIQLGMILSVTIIGFSIGKYLGKKSREYKLKNDSNIYCLNNKRWVINSDVAYPLNDTCKPTDKPVKWDHN